MTLHAPALKNDRLLRALRREPVDATPVWIMRQAGRYLPEYRATRQRAGSFMALCQTPELACEVTLQPLARFKLDASILFSDILTIPDAMGLGLDFVEGEGPQFARPIRDPADLKRLKRPDPEVELRYVMDAVRLIRRELGGRVPLIGFAGAPWTLYCYMVEGGGSPHLKLAKQFAWDQPAAAQQLLGMLAELVADYLIAQAHAGAQALMVFDSHAGALSPLVFGELAQKHLKTVLDRLKADPVAAALPHIVFARGANHDFGALADLGADALGIDWGVRLSAVRALTGGRVALQGNLDPESLYTRPEVLRGMVMDVLEDYGPGPGHVFNLGHGIRPDVNPEQLNVLIDTVHTHSALINARPRLA